MPEKIRKNLSSASSLKPNDSKTALMSIDFVAASGTRIRFPFKL